MSGIRWEQERSLKWSSVIDESLTGKFGEPEMTCVCRDTEREQVSENKLGGINDGWFKYFGSNTLKLFSTYFLISILIF